MAVDGSAAQPGLLKAGAVGWVVEAAACPVRFVTIVDVGCAAVCLDGFYRRGVTPLFYVFHVDIIKDSKRFFELSLEP